MRIHRHRQQKPKYNIPIYRINEKITNPEVRVIDDEEKMLGIISTEEALRIAHSKEMDLVEVSPKAEPPVCKILDFGQFKYQKEKEVKKQKAQSKEVDTKGIRLSVRIGDHDFDVRLGQAKGFLERGDKVRVELLLRGREKAHRDVGIEVAQRFVTELQKIYPLRIEQPIAYQMGKIIAIVARS